MLINSVHKKFKLAFDLLMIQYVGILNPSGCSLAYLWLTGTSKWKWISTEYLSWVRVSYDLEHIFFNIQAFTSLKTIQRTFSRGFGRNFILDRPVWALHIWMLQFHNILFVELLKLCGVDGNCEFKREHFQFMPSASAVSYEVFQRWLPLAVLPEAPGQRLLYAQRGLLNCETL